MIDKDKYPAMASFADSPRSIFMDEMLAEFQSLLADYNALKNAVVILEDGTEPEVGDLVTNIGMAAWWVAEIKDGKFYGVGNKYYGNLDEAKIIQRNGKPCVYKSQLIKEGGE